MQERWVVAIAWRRVYIDVIVFLQSSAFGVTTLDYHPRTLELCSCRVCVRLCTADYLTHARLYVPNHLRMYTCTHNIQHTQGLAWQRTGTWVDISQDHIDKQANPASNQYMYDDVDRVCWNTGARKKSISVTGGPAFSLDLDTVKEAIPNDGMKEVKYEEQVGGGKCLVFREWMPTESL